MRGSPTGGWSSVELTPGLPGLPPGALSREGKEMGTKIVYEVHELTGAVLIDGEGRVTGNEGTGRVFSRHRTREAAEEAARRLRCVSPLGRPVEVREVRR